MWEMLASSYSKGQPNIVTVIGNVSERQCNSSPSPPDGRPFFSLAVHEASVWNSSVCDNLNISFFQ